ncbi:MAG: 3-phosphoshikimate 1-carboxyvinyltransferase [Oscillospiraceae bacterium]|nr:3-phosphoshikimate 1-carboxyvinyltransferase [Oscillospiraceae bacterium]
MKAVIQKGRNEPAAIRIPSSKSMTHRALIAAALAEGDSRIFHPSVNLDTDATIRCLEQLGASVKMHDDLFEVYGCGLRFPSSGTLLDCGESGSTLRFLIPLFALSGNEYFFTGGGKLMERPLTVYRDLFHEAGLLFEQNGAVLRIRGPLKGGTYRIPGDISSQFISGLLFALPPAEEDSVLHIIPPYESRGYVRLTEETLAQAGISVRDEGNTIYIPGNSRYHSSDWFVTGADSQAAVFLALGCMAGQTVEVQGMRHDSLQPDHQIISILRRMGAAIEETEGGYRVLPEELHGCEIDLADCPDLGPVLFALAQRAEGETVFRNAGRLRFKESDRIAAMQEELEKLGGNLHADGGTVIVRGGSRLHGALLSGHYDHRIVMALSALASGLDETVTIIGAEAVNKSYPEFFSDLSTIGPQVHMITE